MAKEKPKGSGYFAVAAGVFFLITFGSSVFFDLRGICPYRVFQGWLVFSATILLVWGVVRVRKGRKNWSIGQPTINFVVGIVGATIALFTLVVSQPGDCG